MPLPTIRRPLLALSPMTTLLRTLTLALLLQGSALADPLLTYPLRIRDQPLRAELANTAETRATGLMFRERLGENAGMLFVYAQPGRWRMWMKNTLIPLSVAFIDAQGRILNVEDMEPQTETPHGAAGSARFALEMNRGWFHRHHVSPGDRVDGLDRIPGGGPDQP